MPLASSAAEHRPLLRPVLQQAVERHNHGLDVLASELQELKLRRQRIEPRLAEEQQLVRRLKRDLTLCRKEEGLIGRGLDQSDRELKRLEACINDESVYAVELESKAASILSESPPAQISLQQESEIEAIKAQRKDILSEIRELHSSNREKEAQASEFLSALNDFATIAALPSGSSSLQSLGSVRANIEELLLCLTRAGEEASWVAEEKEARLLALQTTKAQHRTSVAQLAQCESEIFAAKAEQSAWATEQLAAIEANKMFQGQRASLLSDSTTRQSELDSCNDGIRELEELQESFVEEMEGFKLLAERSHYDSAASGAAMRQHLTQLDSEMRYHAADSQRLHEEYVKDVALRNEVSQGLVEKSAKLQSDLERLKAAKLGLESMDQRTDLHRSEQLSMLSNSREKLESLASSFKVSQTKTAELRRQIAKEVQSAEDWICHAQQLSDKNRADEKQLHHSLCQSEEYRSRASKQRRLAESKGEDLQAHLVSRDVSQAGLVQSITEATQRLSVLCADRDEAESEIIAMRRTNASLRSLVSLS
eukprot:TRINITY_DN80647_c0_g1_i1.p1 TRINITY_DN80647_c0_g1~~TRINITY_DN80647_c0_g1_i1.p1  ORF type:complete len:539 (-),score=125.62 TRINITY_DN80647_c0_g1_i1:127-1743(-)